jgi:signal transduction histidine kinase
MVPVLLLTTAVGTVGAALLLHRRERQLAALVLLGGLSAGASADCGEPLPRWAASVAALLLPVVAVHVALAVPTGRVSRRTRMLLAVAYVVAVAGGAGLAGIAGGLGTCGWAPAAWSLVGADLAAAATTAVVAVRVRSSAQRSARVRTQWFAAGLIVLTPTVAALLPWAALQGTWSDAWRVLAIANVALPLSLIAATAPGTRSFAGRAVRVAAIMAALAMTALVVFLALLFGLGHVPDQLERDVLRLTLIAAYVVVLVAPLVYRSAGRAVDRAVHGDRETQEEMLRRLGGRLSRALPWEESLLQLAESLRESLRLSAVAIYTGSGGSLDRQVALPRRGPANIELGTERQAVVCHAGVRGDGWIPVWLPELATGREMSTLRVVPLCAADELLGVIVAERTDPTDPFGADEEEVLTEMAAQISLAMRNVRLDLALRDSLAQVRQQAEDLRASRTRVVEAADAERQRIERDLHDGAQQSLIALSLRARAAREAVNAENPAAIAYLDDLVGDLRRTADELRELAHGIYPPVLIDSGVGLALRLVAPRCCPGALVDTADGRYPPPVEAAVYFCCLEAMQNAAKYAAGAPVCVRLVEEDRALHFEVSDEGPGFDPVTTRPGHGLVNMADRLGAIGGSLEVTSAPGSGTSVGGRIPLDDGQPGGACSVR